METVLLDNIVVVEKHEGIQNLLVSMHVWGSVRTDERVLREAVTLREQGYAVSILDIESKGTCPAEESIRGIPVKHILMPRSFATTRFKKGKLLKVIQLLIVGIYSLIMQPTDIYHAHDVTALPACYIASLICRKPLVFDAHELPLSDIHIRWHWMRTLVISFLTLMIRHCKGVITVSAPIAQEMRTRYHPSSVTLVRNVPVYKEVSKNDRLRQYLHLAPETRIALYQGNIQSDRRLDVLVRAATFLREDVVIVFMGKGMGDTLQELEALAREEGVAERIKIIPPVPYKELLEWTASADIGLIIYEPEHSLNVQMCLPNKLFEYLMAGLPVLATSLEAVNEVLHHYNVGRTVATPQPEEVGNAINAMLANRDVLATMHRNALKAAQNDLCWEKERLQLIALYKNVVEKSL